MKKLIKISSIAVSTLFIAVSSKAYAVTTDLGNTHLNLASAAHTNAHAYVCLMPEPVNPILFIVGAVILFLVAQRKKLLAV